MAVSVAELVVGPANVWRKPYTDAAVEPATPAATPAAGWVDMGATSDGVNLTIAQSFNQITADQVVDVLMSVPNERSMNVETNLMQPTLERFKVANNGGTITSGVGFRQFEPITDLVSTDIDYGAVLVRGKGPLNQPRDIILRRVATTDDVEFSYVKAGAKVLGITWTAHYVSSSVAPFVIRDAA
jgi:hypothetical protein